MFSPKNPCQSCGMPLEKDPQGGGTTSNGARSTEFCSYCYHSGALIEPNLTVQDMIAKVEGKLKEMWIPLFLGRFFTKNIPHLKRWKH